jgi:hypothetical protein
VLLVPAEARILQAVCALRSQAERLVEFSIGQQPSVGRDLAAQELELQTTVKTDPQIVLFGVTHGVPLSAGHDLAEHPGTVRAVDT